MVRVSLFAGGHTAFHGATATGPWRPALLPVKRRSGFNRTRTHNTSDTPYDREEDTQ